MSARTSVSLPLAVRVLLLAVSFFLFLILNTVGVGAQTSDDHGNTFGSATPISLGSSITGRINPGDDVDVFKLDLSGRSGSTDVWIYTTGELNSLGGLYNSSGNLIVLNVNGLIGPNVLNFHLRRNLMPGVYYIGVYSVGDYDRKLHPPRRGSHRSRQHHCYGNPPESRHSHRRLNRHGK